jgi:hypothetical protein
VDTADSHLLAQVLHKQGKVEPFLAEAVALVAVSLQAA